MIIDVLVTENNAHLTKVFSHREENVCKLLRSH